ncbi:hypothetical protein ACOTXN_22090 [Enterobacter cloacae complex sp. IR53043]|jgi:hypothetical protein|uniref:DUF1419 domain-containing protein n=2 Tax=Enterobacter TaxID=547 RepID=A0ABX4VEK0_9ENTR|nr:MULTISPECIES: hypothetical protein [Enterobacter]ECY4133832.1 hypothetical protein [Salmonella enterica subsp. enterica serovar Infantis]EFS2925609.1 hypothetical protein [Salmonella enterica]HCB2308274.1 hypothetical protein [Escherichia coli]HCM3689604.1 hypothetical protein [Salmonella enterica subsp. enterica serovar Anatum]EDM3611712.1 hypothetical protein [Salmonella enterica subsp. enterica serovar Infantis]
MKVNTPTAAPMAFFVPSLNGIYDSATQLDGQWVTKRKAKTLESLRRLYPDAELIPTTQIQEKLNDGYRRPWSEINEARYIEQLETLALMDWCRGFGGESFKSMEFTGGDVTAIFVRYGARFFECHDLHTRIHRELIGDVITRFCLDAPLNSAH